MAGKQDTTVTGTTTATTTSSNNRGWKLYALLVLVRFACVLLPGYVHPDEFYQGGQELFFGIPPSPHFARLYPPGDYDGSWSWSSPEPSTSSTTSTEEDYGGQRRRIASHAIVPTWEFQPRNAIRSIVPPLLMTVLPLKMYVAMRSWRWRRWGGRDALSVFLDPSNVASWTRGALSGFEMWVMPRLFLAFLSMLAIDWPCYVLMKRFGGGGGGDGGGGRDPKGANTAVPTGLLALASSWPALVFLCRPFTNTLEAMVLSVLLVAVSRDWIVDASKEGGMRKVARSILLGVLSSTGLFVRFTFAFFALPPVMMYVFQKGKIGRILGHGFLISCGFLATSVAFVNMDTIFYSQLSSKGGTDDGERASVGGYYITPLNALLYNSNVDNLGEHGIHPRITHLLVNLPMLFGPLAFFFYADVAAIIAGGLLPRRRKNRTRNQQQRRDISHNNSGRIMCRRAVMSGLFVLSCAPHQEPRFLLPAIVPMVVLYGTNMTERRRWLQKFWILFNTLLLIFFGLLHQSGVVPSLLASNETASTHGSGGPALFLYHHTYMPPSFLTRTKRGSIEGKEAEQCTEDKSTCLATSGTSFSGHLVIDVKDATLTFLQFVMNVALECGIEEFGESEVFLVAPASAQILPPFLSVGILPAISLVDYHRPHITTEDLPRWDGSVGTYVSKLQIKTYKIRCSSQRIANDGTVHHYK